MNGTIGRALRSDLLLWALLALPAAPMLAAVFAGDPRAFAAQLHPTGEFSARFMIIALLATPLTMLLKGWRGPRWLVRHRRHFGVAAFAYAVLHTVFYLVDRGGLAPVAAEMPRLWAWTGWAAFAVLLPLAATSSDRAARLLGPRWKPLQRWAYAAAALTFLHWAALKDWGGLAPALVHFAPLAAFALWRLARRGPAPRAPAA